MSTTLLDFCAKIAAGFDPCGKTPSSAGIEPRIYVFNWSEWVATYNATNPLIVTGFTRIGSALMYEIKGFGDTFDAMSKLTKKDVGPRFTETITAYITDNSSATKQFILNASAGRIGVLVVNNDKSTDGAIEFYGAVNGLQLSDNSQRNASDEALQGAWKLELTVPPKLTEPYPPRSVLIGSGSPTYATTLAAIQAFLVPAA